MNKAWFRTKSEYTLDGQLWLVLRECEERTATIKVFRDFYEVGFWTFTAGGFASPADATNEPYQQLTDYERWPELVKNEFAEAIKHEHERKVW
jgi:hypothetical protein